MTAKVRAALRSLPPVGENPSGPLGPGLLASGQLGAIVRQLQADLSEPDPRNRAAQSGRATRASTRPNAFAPEK
jgi:hypothetical protein